MKRNIATGMATTTLLVVIACSPEAPQARIAGPPAARASMSVSSAKVPNADDLLDSLTGVIPGFGGLFFGKDGNAYVYHSSPGQAGLVGALQTRLAGIVGQRPIHVLQGQYDFHQLRSWKDQAVNILNEPGAVYLDADEARNRVAVAISDPAAESRIVARLSAMGVPKAAIVIDIAHPGATHSTLGDDGLGTLRGGPLIYVLDTGHGVGSTCSLGAIAIGLSDATFNTFYMFEMDFSNADLWQDKYYIVTNSHCSAGYCLHGAHLPEHTPDAMVSKRDGRCGEVLRCAVSPRGVALSSGSAVSRIRCCGLHAHRAVQPMVLGLHSVLQLRFGISNLDAMG